MSFYVYQIVGPTGVYVGKTNNPHKRWLDHLSSARRRARGHLHRAIRKFGETCFFLDLLFVACDDKSSLDAERAIIKQMRTSGKPLYNMTDGGEGTSGFVMGPHTPEARAKIGAAHRGKKTSAETRARQSASVKEYHLKHPEFAAKLSSIATGKKFSDETLKRMAAAGRQLWANASPELRERMSAGRRRPGVS